MNKTTLTFLKSGLQTLVQDGGRPHHRAYGVPAGGALDQSSMIIANKLVGNSPTSPVLETAISGPKVRFNGDDCIIAVTGADISATLNDKKFDMYRCTPITNNDILAFGKLNSGCRAYIAISGDWQARKWLNSASAAFQHIDDVTPDSFISKDSVITILHDGKMRKLFYPEHKRPAYPGPKVIRVLAGPEMMMFKEVSLRKFFEAQHSITPASNRWGYKLQTEFPLHSSGTEIISSGIIPGTIQIPHSGQPIVLMADAQTTGGYPRLAVVISADMDKLAQCKPGDLLRFELVDFSIAIKALEYRMTMLNQL